jgi:phosphomannomutase
VLTHQFHPTILREYDIRGIIDETLSANDAYAIGRALGSLCVAEGGKTACVGRDGRLSSPALEAAAVRGLADCGLSVTRVGLGPTPMLYYAQKARQADVGLMITGSHNPPNHNGFKMMMGGKPFFGASITRLGEIAASGAFASGEGAVDDAPMLGDYVARLLSDWDGGDRALTVVWDAGNGAAGEAMCRLVEGLPGRHVLLYADIDGTFPNHHPDPTDPHTLTDLMARVKAEGADLGIAFDGDGDRIGIVDSSGRILWGDQILQILAEDVLRSLPGATIIADVKASQGLFDEVARMGGQPLMWKTGHSLVKTKMAETGAPLAGEMSGHIFFADKYYGFDDALYAAVRFLGIVARMDEPLTARADRMPNMVNTPELRFDCPDEQKFSVVEAVRATLKAQGAELSEVDGVRVRTAHGWWLLRASNTQAVLVARAEADSLAHLDETRATLAQTLGLALQQVGVPLPAALQETLA